MTAKDIGKLKLNMQNLPRQIVQFERQGRQAEADRCRSILAECRMKLAAWEARQK